MVKSHPTLARVGYLVCRNNNLELIHSRTTNANATPLSVAGDSIFIPQAPNGTQPKVLPSSKKTHEAPKRHLTGKPEFKTAAIPDTPPKTQRPNAVKSRRGSGDLSREGHQRTFDIA